MSERFTTPDPSKHDYLTDDHGRDLFPILDGEEVIAYAVSAQIANNIAWMFQHHYGKSSDE